MDATKACKSCSATKPLADFEATPAGHRTVCKACRTLKRKASTASAIHDPSTVPKPTACDQCGKDPSTVDFKWRSDVKAGGWRSTCNTCINAKGYHKDYRVRERAKDAEAFLKRNAATHLAWAHRNKDKVREQQVKLATEPDRKIKALVTSAAQRGVSLDKADIPLLAAKFTQPCHFCQYVNGPGEPINGLDRIDSNMGYTDANTVPCCATCNAMKGAFHVDEFVHNVRQIVRHRQIGPIVEPNQQRTRLLPFAGRADLRARDAKQKADHLDTDDKVALWSSPCYLCGRAPALGIDREDANGDYTVANSRPCCSDCNYMKKDIALDDFCKHVAYVHAHTDSWVIGDVSDLPLLDCSGAPRLPVAAIDTTGRTGILFPSVGTAVRIIGRHTIATSIDVVDKLVCGFSWKSATSANYRYQNIDSNVCKQILKAMHGNR